MTYLANLYEITNGERNDVDSLYLNDINVGNKIKFEDGFIYIVQDFTFDKDNNSYCVHVEPEPEYKLTVVKYKNLYYSISNNSRCINVSTNPVTFDTQNNSDIDWVDSIFIDYTIDSEQELFDFLKSEFGY